MDTRKLVIGQHVWMLSSDTYLGEGTVVDVTPPNVIVLCIGTEREFVRFDAYGEACDSRDLYDGPVWSCTELPGVPCSNEGGPWELVEDDEISECWKPYAGRLHTLYTVGR